VVTTKDAPDNGASHQVPRHNTKTTIQIIGLEEVVVEDVVMDAVEAVPVEEGSKGEVTNKEATIHRLNKCKTSGLVTKTSKLVTRHQNLNTQKELFTVLRVMSMVTPTIIAQRTEKTRTGGRKC
jgi:hypothetical protein